MASIVKRGKSYSVVYYVGKGKNRHQEWESGLSYSAAKAFKAKIENMQAEEKKAERIKSELDKKGLELSDAELSELVQTGSLGDSTMAEIISPDLKNMTISDFLYEFTEKYGTQKWRDSTYTGNTGLMENYIHPYIGEKLLRTLKTKDIDDYYHFLLTEAEPATNMGRPMRDHITASTVNDIHKLLRTALNKAVDWEYLKKNPCLKAIVPEYKEKERTVLEPEQILKVLDFACRPEHYDYYVIYCAILIAVGCTVRGGEIGGLQWEYINFDKGTFHVCQAIDRVSKKNLNLPKMEIKYQFPNLYPGTKTCIVLKQLKNDGGIRDVDVPEYVLMALRELKSMQNKLKEELGSDGYMDYGLVICQANGRPIMTEHLNARFKSILAEMKDPEFNPEELVFHSLRHTSATAKLFVSNGDFNSVKQAGGWRTLEMLTRRYGNHSFTSNREKMAQKMNGFLSGGEPQQEPEALSENQEELLKKLLEANPDLLMKVVRSIQPC